MLGEFSSFSGGLNLTGNPRNREEFRLNEAVALSNVDVLDGTLKGVKGLGPAVGGANGGSTPYWDGENWLASTDTRSYVQAFGELFFTNDEGQSAMFARRPDEDFRAAGAETMAATVYGDAGATGSTSVEFRVGQNAPAYYNPGQQWGGQFYAWQATSFNNAFVLHQRVRITSYEPLGSLRPGDTVECRASGVVLVGLYGSVVHVQDEGLWASGAPGYLPYGAIVTVSLWQEERLVNNYVHILTQFGSRLVQIVLSDVTDTASNEPFPTFRSTLNSIELQADGTREIVTEEIEYGGLVAYDVLHYDVSSGEADYQTLGRVSESLDLESTALDQGTYKYRMTWVSDGGLEGAPVPADDLELAVEYEHNQIRRNLTWETTERNGQTIRRLIEATDDAGAATMLDPLTHPVVSVGGWHFNLSDGNGGVTTPGKAKVRLYRTTADGADYFLLEEFDGSEMAGEVWTYVDSTSDWVLVGNPALDSESNYPPVWTLDQATTQRDYGRYLTYHLGRLFQAVRRRLYYCKAGEPHYWPLDNWFELPDEITGLVSASGVLLILTSTTVWRLAGLDEGSWTLTQVPTALGTDNHHSIAKVANSAMWANVDGICAFTGTGVEIVTWDRIGELALFSEIRCAVGWQQQYVGFTEDGRWLSVDFARGGRVLQGQLPTSWVWGCAVDPVDGSLVVSSYSAGQITLNRMFEGDRLAYEYTTGKDTGGMPGVLKHFSKVFVQLDGSVQLDVLLDGRETVSMTISGSPGETVSRYLPATRNLRAESIQFRVSGTGTVYLLRYEAEPMDVR